MTGIAAPYIVLASGMFLLAEAIRRRARLPLYVHAIAIGVGIVSAIVLWRGGGLYGSGLGNAFTLLVPPGAIYFFFFRNAASSPARRDDTRRPANGHVRDRDV